MTSAKRSLSKSSDLKAKQQSEIIAETVREYRTKLPKQRPPVIIVSGTTGNGKSTTINSLFGKKVAKVGHFARGTKKDKVYEWESKSENIHIVDLPGLGDSDKNDKVFSRIYSRQAKQTDGVIVVICPPRPAHDGTLRTVGLLLKAGIPSQKIIFGYNKVSHLKYEKQGKTHSITLNGIGGITSPQQLKIVEQAKREFLKSLRAEFPKSSFSIKQIIEYDSMTGWNLYKMLGAVVELLPYYTLKRFKRVATQAQKEVAKKEQQRLAREKLRLKRKQELLQKKLKQQQLKKKRQTEINIRRERDQYAREKSLREEEIRLKKERERIQIENKRTQDEMSRYNELLKQIEETKKIAQQSTLLPTHKNEVEQDVVPTNPLQQLKDQIEQHQKETLLQEKKLQEEEARHKRLSKDFENYKERQKRIRAEERFREEQRKREEEKETQADLARTRLEEQQMKTALENLKQLQQEKPSFEKVLFKKFLEGISTTIAEMANPVIGITIKKAVELLVKVPSLLKELGEKLFGL